MRFRIAQCLCGPARHAILGMGIATPVDELSDDDACIGLRAAVQALVAGRGDPTLGIPMRIDSWCGICGAPSHAWIYEIGWSIPFADWEAVQHHMKALEAANRQSRALLDLLDLSFDAKVRAADASTPQ